MKTVNTPSLVAENSSPKEAEIVRQARGGDLRAFTVLVEFYQERAIHVAYSFTGNFEDARDLAQEAFVKAYENLGKFKAESRFYTWFYRILANGCKDHLRKKKVRAAISFGLRRDEENREDSFEDRIADSSRNAKEEILNRELGQELYKALEKLPFRQKSAFTLRYLEGMSLEEAGEAMQVSVGAVKAHLWQALQKMKKILGPYLANPGEVN